MSRAPAYYLRKRTSFTLVELLVAISVLSIMFVALATIMGFVTKTWLNGIGMADNFTKARVVLNLLDRDIQMMVLRRDLAAFVNSTNSTIPACSFYSNIQGNPGGALTSPDTRTVSLVQYLLNPTMTTTTPTLIRYNYGMNFSTVTTSSVIPTVGTTTTLPSPTNGKQQTDTLFTGIIQFQWQFIDGTGAILTPPYSLTSLPPATSSPPSGTTPFWFDFAVPGATYNPRAVVISMVVLSNSAYKLAIQTGTMSTVVGCFSTTVPTNQTYSQVWNGFLAAPNSAFLSLPEPIRHGILVFERHVPLPMTPPSR